MNPSTVFDLLSERGKLISFPTGGILAQTAEAKGKKINASIGIALEEDGTPMHLSSISELIKLPLQDIFPYSPGYGKADLRRRWLELMKQKNPSLTSPTSLPVVTSALTHALSISGFLFANPGDKIISADKFWGNYKLIFENVVSAKLATHNTFANGGFDLASFKKAISEGTGKKIILLNFPNNPAGYMLTTTEADQVVQILLKNAEAGNKLVVILDDAYTGIVFEQGVLKESLFGKLANLHPNLLAVKVDGASKEEYAWGLRVGFLTYAIKGGTKKIYDMLESKTAGTVRGQVSNVSNLTQSLILAGTLSPNYAKEKEKKFELLKSRYLEIKKVLANPRYLTTFTPLPFNAGYFMCLELANGIDSELVRKKLLTDYDTGVISMPGGLLRLAFSSVSLKNIPMLVENIYLASLEFINKK